jgi:hypothetical protein
MDRHPRFFKFFTKSRACGLRSYDLNKSRDFKRPEAKRYLRWLGLFVASLLVSLWFGERMRAVSYRRAGP